MLFRVLHFAPHLMDHKEDPLISLFSLIILLIHFDRLSFRLVRLKMEETSLTSMHEVAINCLLILLVLDLVLCQKRGITKWIIANHKMIFH